jgi:hypothetical protein
LLGGLLADIAYAVWTTVKGPYVLGAAFVGALVLIDVVIAVVVGLLLAGATWLLLRFRRGRKSRLLTIAVETAIALPCVALVTLGVMGNGDPWLLMVPTLVVVAGLLVIVLSF